MDGIYEYFPIKEHFVSNAVKTAVIYRQIVIESIITAIILLVALAYNEVIQQIIKNYYPNKADEPLRGKLIYALFITLLIVVLQIYVFPYFSANEKFIRKL